MWPPPRSGLCVPFLRSGGQWACVLFLALTPSFTPFHFYNTCRPFTPRLSLFLVRSGGRLLLSPTRILTIPCAAAKRRRRPRVRWTPSRLWASLPCSTARIRDSPILTLKPLAEESRAGHPRLVRCPLASTAAAVASHRRDQALPRHGRRQRSRPQGPWTVSGPHPRQTSRYGWRQPLHIRCGRPQRRLAARNRQPLGCRPSACPIPAAFRQLGRSPHRRTGSTRRCRRRRRIRIATRHSARRRRQRASTRDRPARCTSRRAGRRGRRRPGAFGRTGSM